MPELVDIDEDQDTVTVPADQNADKDFFQDSEWQAAVKQKYDGEIKQAPWNPQANLENPLMKIGDMITQATPVYEGFWKNSDGDILLRLDVASEELKSKRRSKTQKETTEKPTPHGQHEIDVEDPHPNRPESPSLLMKTQDNLEDTMSNIPVEPVTPQTGPPKVIPPMPYSDHDNMAPPTSDTDQFQNQAKIRSKDENRTPTTEGQDVGRFGHSTYITHQKTDPWGSPGTVPPTYWSSQTPEIIIIINQSQRYRNGWKTTTTSSPPTNKEDDPSQWFSDQVNV